MNYKLLSSRNSLLFLVLLASTRPIFSQDALTLEDAIEIALDNNYAIKIV
ncbi:MAG: hypothetical protein O2887_08525 [Bacteroidetes bacterium]|nr:hypothetical protein [Bacteroidota bacterium]MDA1120523.1 hypothetical protein [Bacteroidota bacterium]